MARVRPMLEGVPETLLWTLYNRAYEAGQLYPVIDDPMALHLMADLDYPFEERFGRPNAFHSQAQALRSRCFDLTVQGYLRGHPEATVVALGDGLETGFWRVDNGRLTWLSVELPQVAALRRMLLPSSDRLRTLSRSATDLSWLDEIEDPAGRGVIVTTQGLLMYLQPWAVRKILATCAERLPGGVLVLDSMARLGFYEGDGGREVEDRLHDRPADALGDEPGRAEEAAQCASEHHRGARAGAAAGTGRDGRTDPAPASDAGAADTDPRDDAAALRHLRGRPPH